MALTCRAGWHITRDQLMWRHKLWLRAKVINLGLFGPNFEPNPLAGMLVRDPLLVNNKLLYEILNPDSCTDENHEDLDFGNLLSKMATPTASMGLTELFENLVSLFSSGTPQNSSSDPFSKGEGAPTFLLFGMPETKVSKKLALSFIASKDSTFETVGLVKGKPGGVGGGVTVRYGHNLMNLLTVRRARPRLLVDGPSGTAFHPDVAEVIPRVDGLICYMDSSCCCENIENVLHSSKMQNGCCTHTHTIDVLELEAMMRTIPPDLSPPILVLLAHLDDPHPTSSDDSDLDHDDFANIKSRVHKKSQPHFNSHQVRHRPTMLYNVLGTLDLPWAICEVEVKTLAGVHRGLNWLLHRTLKLKSG
nr:uncharacterized protein LOC123757921 [Procambarus clarkii]